MSESNKPAVSPHTYAWWAVLCLVGLDYFSTLAYLPSIAVGDVGALAPVAAGGVVAITLLAAVLTVLAFGLYFYLVRGLSRGFLRLAVVVVVLYLLLTGLVVGSGLLYLSQHPDRLDDWRAQVDAAWATSPAAPGASFAIWAL